MQFRHTVSTLLNGPIAKVQTGDMLIIDAEAGVLDVEIDDDVWPLTQICSGEFSPTNAPNTDAPCSAGAAAARKTPNNLVKIHQSRFESKELKNND
jgi:dihydroxyacid dehydratase/phosphogluconate dehydratase